jgi:alkanesulfonate monooxygenase SsuD/methylene tetrahydromethanopterin reductase-like flavin-dependent oxidoreductase (luciferase family)
MRLGIALVSRHVSLDDPRPVVQQLVDLAQNIERLGFAGLWVTDTVGRGNRSLDPLMVLAALSSTTTTIELGVGIVQLPLREPVELAHRVQTLNLFSGGRLRLGIGAGSTRTDFEALNRDFDRRFETLPEYLDMMQRTWRGEAVYRHPITVWPGTEGGPPVYLGAWRSERWINLAATRCQGWMASGNHTGWDDLMTGVTMFRKAGGQRAILTSIHTDVRPEDKRGKITTPALFNLHCSPAEARDRLKRLEDAGFDDAVMYPPTDDPAQLEAIRDLI